MRHTLVLPAAALAIALAACGASDSLDDAKDPCAGFDDAKGEPVSIVVKNLRSQPIFVGSREYVCNQDKLFELRNSKGELQTIETGQCYSCQTAMKWECAYSCRPNVVYRVEPGASATLPWDGSIFLQRKLPNGCVAWDSNPDGLDCYQSQATPAGDYEVHVVASSHFACNQLLGGECTCDGPEPCRAYGIGEQFEASTVMHLPADRTVQVVFEP